MKLISIAGIVLLAPFLTLADTFEINYEISGWTNKRGSDINLPSTLKISVEDEKVIIINISRMMVTSNSYIPENRRLELIDALKKALTWFDKAEEAGLDATKEFFTSGEEDKANYTSFKFVSSNEGKTGEIVIANCDVERPIRYGKLRLEGRSSIKNLIRLFESVPDQIEKYKYKKAHPINPDEILK